MEGGHERSFHTGFSAGIRHVCGVFESALLNIPFVLAWLRKAPENDCF